MKNNRFLKMKRISKEGPGPELYFEEGKRFSSNYETPMGPMEVEVLTRSIKNLMDQVQIPPQVGKYSV